MSSFKIRTAKIMYKMPLMVSCRDFHDAMMEHIEGEASAYKRFKMYFHMKMCPQCSVYVNEYKKTIELGKSVFSNMDAPLPEDVPEELIQAILKAKK